MGEARDSCESGGSPCGAEFVKHTGTWWGAEERGFTIFPVKTSLRDGSISSHSLDGRSVSVFKRQQPPQLHPWHFSSIKSCRIPHEVSLFPLQPHLGRRHRGPLATAMPILCAGEMCSSLHSCSWGDSGTGGWRSCWCCCWSSGRPDTPQPSSRPPHRLTQL